MYQYLDLLGDVARCGVQKSDRTGVGTRSLFGRQLRFDLSTGFFPLLTTKRLHTASIVVELLWMIGGQTNVQFLHRHGVTIWDEWADKDGEVGPVYGKQWRNWATTDYTGVDQLAAVIDQIKTNPNSRRLIVNAWNVGDLPYMALPPCHLMFQFYVAKGRLSCMMTQRSADVFLGLPFNIASYALLTSMVAQVTDLRPGELVINLGDVHLYNNHVEQAYTQLERVPRKLPTLRLNPEVKDIDRFQFSDITFEGYEPWPTIKAEVAV